MLHKRCLGDYAHINCQHELCSIGTRSFPTEFEYIGTCRTNGRLCSTLFPAGAQNQVHVGKGSDAGTGRPYLRSMVSADWISIVNIVCTVAAIVAAPIIALWISGRLQRRSAREAAKLQLFSTLMATRHDALAPDAIRALNSIDLVFVDNFPVREAWSRYYAAIIDQNLNIPIGYSAREERRRDLLLAMTQAMDLSNRISTTDLLRSYIPALVGEQQYIGILERAAKIAALREELAKRNIPDPAPGFVSPGAPEPPTTARPSPAGVVIGAQSGDGGIDGKAPARK